MDNYKTPLGEIQVTFIGHASVMIRWNGRIIYTDPYSEIADYHGRPKADLILITHAHYDHYDAEALSEIEKPSTIFVVSKNIGKKDKRYRVLLNGESTDFEGIHISAVPSYNINRRNDHGDLFHPKGEGNGYILDFNGFKLFFAGDTEPVAEMKYVTNIDIAFLPKNLPYTMTDEEFVSLANAIRPTYLYPIHFFELDTSSLLRHLDTGITLIDTNKK